MTSIVCKRTIAIALMGVLLLSPAAFAAGSDDQAAKKDAEQQKRVGLYKIIGGAAVASIGFMFIANSHASETIKTGIGTFKASATNTGGMVAGAALLGAGGFLIVMGAKDRSAAAKPTVNVGMHVGRTSGMFVRRAW